MGKKTKKKDQAPAAEPTEDELLDQAIVENKAAAAAAAAAAASEAASQLQTKPLPAAAAGKKRVLTRHEVVATLDQVMMLNIVASGDGQDAKIVPGIDGDVVWYSSIVDARAALGKMQEAMPSVPGFTLGLNFTPLGRALALSEGWMGPKAGSGPPMRLQASQTVKDAVGEGVLAGSVPRHVAKNNSRTGAFPLFFLDELQSESVMPFFFSREELIRCWAASGRQARSRRCPLLTGAVKSRPGGRQCTRARNRVCIQTRRAHEADAGRPKARLTFIPALALE